MINSMIETNENWTMYEFAGQLIRMRKSDGYFNATDMCKVNPKKKLNDFLRSKDTKEYLEALEADLKGNFSAESNTEISVLGLIEVNVGGSHLGTWAHPEVSVKLAGWISKPFEIKVNRWVHRFLQVGSYPRIHRIKIIGIFFFFLCKKVSKKETPLNK